MTTDNITTHQVNITLIRWLTYLMFLMFAMTTDAVGVIIPELMSQFDLGMTKAGMIHYGPMLAIAISGLAFGFLPDRLGRKQSIILGLSIFSVSAFCFIFGNTFYFFLSLMIISGLAIGIFRSSALALIGDISTSTVEHTRTTNGVEAFFAIGAIIGPFIVTSLLARGVDWKWLYFIAGFLCLILITLASMSKYPTAKRHDSEPVNLARTLHLMKDPYTMGFSLGAFLYVASESAIYVWMPTYLQGYHGPNLQLAAYALTLFFVLRAVGRFLGMWLLGHFNWTTVMVLCSGIIAACFIGAVIGGRHWAVYLLPASGLFMSVIYPTLNSKGISCFEKNKHGTVAGLILFFTAAGAAIGPLIMGLVSDWLGGDPVYGFMVATFFSGILFIGFLYNWLKKPVEAKLRSIEQSEYA